MNNGSVNNRNDSIELYPMGLTEEQVQDLEKEFPQYNVDGLGDIYETISEEEAETPEYWAIELKVRKIGYNPDLRNEREAVRGILDMSYVGGVIYIINPEMIDASDEKYIIETFCEADYPREREVILFTGELNNDCYKNNKRLGTGIKVFPNYYEMKEYLKYAGLTMEKNIKKDKRFYRQISDCLMILKMIQDGEAVSSKQIAEKLECSTRTVLRYIETLRVAGEPIQYDFKKKTWTLDGDESSLLSQQ